MVTHHRFAEIAGRRIFYREAGSPAAPAVVLLHGTPASSHQYRNLIPALADRYHVIAPDYPGFGHSDVPSVEEFSYTFDNLADHVDTLLDHLGLQRYAIYVQDYGAPVGWRLALRHPERIAAIITQNGNAYVEGFFGDAMEPLFAYGRERSEANAAALREIISMDGLKWQFTHGASDPSVVDPDTWINAHSAVASSPERVAAPRNLCSRHSAERPCVLSAAATERCCHCHAPVTSSWREKLRNVRISTMPPSTATLSPVGVTATVRMMSAATKNSRPRRIARPRLAGGSPAMALW
jgi:pimeloyl-ACP methyl ester carboxylesterase